MARLTNNEIAEAKGRLAQWQSPVEMAGIVEEIMDRLGSDFLFIQAGLAFIRDSWIAAEFGKLVRAEHVRLVDDDWPDFELRNGDRIEQFEAVEADDPKRRRGDEYRDSTGEVEDDPVEDWVARANEAPAWLEAACQKKADKRYGARASLVIYLNLAEYGIRQKEVESCFPMATGSVKDSFDAVWVLWKKQAYLVWQGGNKPTNP